jgi:hypothetical protein
MIRSMLRVTEEVGRTPSVDDYRSVSPVLRAAGEDIARSNICSGTSAAPTAARSMRWRSGGHHGSAAPGSL